MGTLRHWFLIAACVALISPSAWGQSGSCVDVDPTGQQCGTSTQVRIRCSDRATCTCDATTHTYVCSTGGAMSDPLDISEARIDRIYAKGHPVYDVKHTDFGALCNGSDDDTSEIQSAIDNADANGGGIIQLPEGDCVLSCTGGKALNIKGKDNIAIQGLGRLTRLVLADDQTPTCHMIQALGSGASPTKGVTLRDFAINGNRTGQFDGASDKWVQQYPIFMSNSQGVRIENVWVQEAGFAGIYFYHTVGDALGVDDFSVTNSTIEDTGNQGLLLTGATNGSVKSNRFLNIGTVAIKTEDTRIFYGVDVIGNTIDTANSGIILQGEDGSDGDSNPEYFATGINIIGNTIRNIRNCTTTPLGSATGMAIGVDHLRGFSIIGNQIDDGFIRGISVESNTKGGVVSGNNVRGILDEDGGSEVSGDCLATPDLESGTEGRAGIIVWASGSDDVAPQDIIVSNNTVRDCDVSGIRVHGDVVDDSTGGGAADGIIVEGNILRDNAGSGGGAEMWFYAVQNMEVSGNWIFQDGTGYWVRGNENDVDGDPSYDNANWEFRGNHFVNTSCAPGIVCEDTPTRNPFHLGSGLLVEHPDDPGRDAYALEGLSLIDNVFPDNKAHVNDAALVSHVTEYSGNRGGTEIDWGTSRINSYLSVAIDADIDGAVHAAEVEAGSELRIGQQSVTVSGGALYVKIGGGSGTTKLNSVEAVGPVTQQFNFSCDQVLQASCPIAVCPVAAGYTACENGTIYSGGRTYGWDSNLGTSNCRQRNAGSPTATTGLCFSTGSTEIWRLDTTNGDYVVTVTVGDDSFGGIATVYVSGNGSTYTPIMLDVPTVAGEHATDALDSGDLVGLDSVASGQRWSARVAVAGTPTVPAACISADGARLFHDIDCDGTRDAGDEWIDATVSGDIAFQSAEPTADANAARIWIDSDSPGAAYVLMQTSTPGTYAYVRFRRLP